MADTAIGKAAVVLSVDSGAVKPGMEGAAKEATAGAEKAAGGISAVFGRIKGAVGSALSAAGSSVAGFLTTTLDAGLQGSAKVLGGRLSGAVQAAAESARGGLQSAGSWIGTKLGGAAGGALGKALGGAIGGIGTVVATAIGGALDKVGEFGTIVKRANALGVDASQYQGLTKVFERAGLEAGEVNDALVVMSKLVSDAASGYGNAFGKAAHGFEIIGLDAKKLAAMAPDEQFKAIASGIAALKNPTEQAAAATHIFGARAADLLPELQKGGQGVQDFIDMHKRFGSVLTTEQLKAAAAANKAWKDAKTQIAAAWDGLKNRAAMIAAPIIEGAGKAIQQLMEFVAPVFDWLGRGLGAIADIVSAVTSAVGGLIKEVIGTVGNWISETFHLGNSTLTIRDVVVGAFRIIGTVGAGAFDLITAAASPLLYVLGQIVVVVTRVMDAILDLVAEIPSRFKPDWFMEFEGGARRAVDGVRKVGQGISDYGEKRFNEVLKGDIFTSAKQFNAWLDRVTQQKKEAAQEAIRDVRNATEKDEKKEHAGHDKFDNAALLRGSAADVSARLKYEMGTQYKEQLAEAKKTNDLLRASKELTKVIAEKVGGVALLPL